MEVAAKWGLTTAGIILLIIFTSFILLFIIKSCRNNQRNSDIEVAEDKVSETSTVEVVEQLPTLSKMKKVYSQKGLPPPQRQQKKIRVKRTDSPVQGVSLRQFRGVFSLSPAPTSTPESSHSQPSPPQYRFSWRTPTPSRSSPRHTSLSSLH